MAVTYDANYADYNVAYLANRIVATYATDPLLFGLLTNASQFTDLNGSYRPGASILINSVDTGSTSFVADVTTNSALSSSKPSTTQYTLDLDKVAVTQIDYDAIEKTFSNAWQPAIDAIVRKYAADHLDSIEAQLYIDTFNDAGISELGATDADTALDFDDLAVIDQKFTEANVPASSRRYLVLPPKMYRELLQNASAEFDLSADENMVRTSAISTKYNLTVFRSNNMPALSAMTNYTAGSITTTNKVGVAFTDDSIAMFNPDMTIGSTAGIEEQVIKENGFSTTLTRSVNNDLNVPEARSVMRSLFGTVIYRPTAVFGIKNGNIS